MEHSTYRRGGPVIGIGAHAGPARWAIWEKPVALLPLDLLGRVAAAGCVPVVLPPLPRVEEAVDRLDGLLLPGGLDVDPARYGAPPHSRGRPVDPNRDAAEFALLEAALRAELPVLGICRGLQVMNIARGGTLHQFLPDVVGHDGHNPASTVTGSQQVRVLAGSRTAAVLGAGAATVPCHHDQAVDRLGRGVRPTAWSDDGMVEAIELEDHPFAVGVQWHAEDDPDDSFFRALADAARQRSHPVSGLPR